MIRQVDHIVIYVQDLAAAIEDYSVLGFTVVPGGEHPGGATHNALVIFEDGVYLELIAFKRSAPEHRWWHKAQRGGHGLLDWAVLPENIAGDLADARHRGLQIEGPIPGGRLRPDDVQVAWQTARTETFDVPFLCGDVTPRELRVPIGAVRQHRNGVKGVASIVVVVHDLDTSVQRYGALLNSAVTIREPDPDNGVRSRTLTLGSTAIMLATPEPATNSDQTQLLREHLAIRGEGPYALAFHTGHVHGTTILDLERTQGVPIELVAGANVIAA